MTSRFDNKQSQCLVFISVSLAVGVLTGILYFRNNLIFQSYIGRINPLLAIFSSILLGLILFSYLLPRGWHVIHKKGNLNGLLISSCLGAIFALGMILVDLRIVFPDDLNMLFPESLLFYPAIGYVVEIFFHVLPISLFLLGLTSLSKKIRIEKMIWPVILTVSLLEPVYQAVLGSSRQYPLWLTAYVGLHVYFINLFQLLIFKRYDFISMYSFRLAYYVLWHIVWGYMRLKLLF